MLVDDTAPPVSAARGGGDGDVRAAVAGTIRTGLGYCARNGIPSPPVAAPTLAALEAGERVAVPGWLVPRYLQPAWVDRAQESTRLRLVILWPDGRVDWLRGNVCGRLILFWDCGEDPAGHDADLEREYGPGAVARLHAACCGVVS
ncbi:hypothetical protein [Mycolicibacter sinensis]